MREGPSKTLLLQDAEARIEELKTALIHGQGAVEVTFRTPDASVLTAAEGEKLNRMYDELDTMQSVCDSLIESIRDRFDKAEADELTESSPTGSEMGGLDL